MNLTYDREADTLRLEFLPDKEQATIRDLNNNMRVEYTAGGKLAAMEIGNLRDQVPIEAFDRTNLLLPRRDEQRPGEYDPTWP